MRCPTLLRSAPRKAAARAFALLLAATACGIGTRSFAQECAKIHDIAITYEFAPKELRIRAGDCVRWTNIHDIEHSAAGFAREFNTGQLMPGGRALITFDKPAEIPYWCTHHPPMQAKLIVEKK